MQVGIVVSACCINKAKAPRRAPIRGPWQDGEVWLNTAACKADHSSVQIRILPPIGIEQMASLTRRVRNVQQPSDLAGHDMRR